LALYGLVLVTTLAKSHLHCHSIKQAKKGTNNLMAVNSATFQPFHIF